MITSIRSLAASAVAAVLFLALAFAADDDADRLPPGPGKAAVVKVCGDCHGYDDIRKLRLSKDDWNDKLSEMVINGAKASDQELAAILDYLAQTFGPDSKIWVNTAPFAELKSVLKLTNEETDALIAFRSKNGPFKTWDEVAKAPGVDAKKIEAGKDKIAF